MGVYVPFIKMPKTCADCVFWSICDLWEGKNPYGGKDPNCPLVDSDQGQVVDINYLEPGCFYGLGRDRVFYKVNIPTNVWENAKLIALPTIQEKDGE